MPLFAAILAVLAMITRYVLSKGLEDIQRPSYPSNKVRSIPTHACQTALTVTGQSRLLSMGTPAQRGLV